MDAKTLQKFNNAKRDFGEIVNQDLLAWVVRIRNLLSNNPDLFDAADNEAIASFYERIKGIQEVVARDRMKIVFFGRTSNGKSTVINAILRNKILPSGSGHTTNCFVQVEGTDETEPFLLQDGQRRNVKDIGLLANALSEGVVAESSIVPVFWPKQQCELLRHDIVFVDAPGIDMSESTDEWIDSHCLDSDVFVYVANGESVITLTETDFFKKIANRLSNPNVFVLYNKWDTVANDELSENPVESVRSDQQRRGVKFLINDLKVGKEEEAESRIFFVSAREALVTRLKVKQGEPAGIFALGYQARYSEFEDFEKAVMESLSTSAVRTKFQQHSLSAKAIVNDACRILSGALERTPQLLKKKKNIMNKQEAWIESTNAQLVLVREDMEKNISSLSRIVASSTGALDTELSLLNEHLEDYTSRNEIPTTSSEFANYQNQLAAFMHSNLWSGTSSRLSSALAVDLRTPLIAVIGRVRTLLPTEDTMTGPRAQAETKIDQLENLVLYEEEIEARRPLLAGMDGLDRSNIPDERWFEIDKVNGLMGGLFVTYQFSRFYPIIRIPPWAAALTASVVGAVGYIQHQLAESNMLQNLKDYYIKSGGIELQEYFRICSATIQRGIEEKLSTALAGLCDIMDATIEDTRNEIETLERALIELTDAEEELNQIRERSDEILHKLESFQKEYL